MVKGNPDELVGMCLHILFSSLEKAWRTQQVNHIIFIFDGHSWRKSVYAPYKLNREVKRAAQSPEEKNLDTIFLNAFNIFKNFVTEKTNCTVLYNAKLESDDLISAFIASHPTDNHVILSNDKDFEQLLASNVIMYDGVADETITIDGIFNSYGKKVTDKKTGLPKVAPNPAWSVFEKAIRGCPTDNIFPAYPKIREKSSKNKIGLREAFNDRDKQGFAYSSIMMHRWIDHNGVEHRVLDDFKRNKELVDLTAQPNNIKQLMNETIKNACKTKNISMVGVHFLKFCGEYQLERLSKMATKFAIMLNSSYPSTSSDSHINSVAVQL
jgi:hypothetical protein